MTPEARYLDHLRRLPRRPPVRGVPARTSTPSTHDAFDALRRRAARDPRPADAPTAASTSRTGRRRTPKACAARTTRPSATRSSTATASPARSCSRTPTRSRVARHRRSAPGSRRPTSPIRSSRSPARARTTGSWPRCARTAPNVAPALRSCRSRTTSTVRSTRSNGPPTHGLRGGILVPTMWRGPPAVRRSDVRTGVGRVRGGRHAGAHALGVGAAGRVPGQRRRVPRRGGVVGGPADVVPAVRRRVRTASELEVLHHRVGRLLGTRPDVEVGHLPRRRPHDEEARRPARGQGEPAAERVLRDERVHRRVDDEPRGDPSPLRHRHRHRDVGQRLPAPRGHVAAHRREARRRRSTTSRSSDTELMLGGTAARACTASTPTRSRRSPRASARRRPTSARTRAVPSIPRRSAGAAGGRKVSSARDPYDRERERIIAAARAGSSSSDGVDALSMRKLAAELGVAHTAIYWHVGGRDELVDAVIDSFLADLGDITPRGRTPPSAHGVGRARDPPAGRRAPCTGRARDGAGPLPRACGSPRRSRSRERSARPVSEGADAARAVTSLLYLAGAFVMLETAFEEHADEAQATVDLWNGVEDPRIDRGSASTHGQGFRRVRRCSRTRSKRCSTGSSPTDRRTTLRKGAMEFGLFNSACVLPQFDGDEHRRIMDEVAIVRAGDRVGFKYTWATEHHFLDGVLAPLGERGRSSATSRPPPNASTSARASSTSRRR